MTKQEKEQILHAYLDNELGMRERVEMEEQLDADPTLRAELRFYRKMRQQLQDAPCKLASAALAGRIHARLQGEERSARWAGFWQISMASGMACAMTALIFFWSRQPNTTHPSENPRLAERVGQKDLPSSHTTEPSVQGSTPVAEGAQPAQNGRLHASQNDPIWPAESSPTETRLARCPRKYKAWLRQRAQERERTRRLQALRLLKMYHPSLAQKTVTPVPTHHRLHPPKLFQARPISRAHRP